MHKKRKWSISKMCTISALVAVDTILSRFVSINTMGIRIGFGFVPIMIAAYTYGPIEAGITSALADLSGALLFPSGPFHPGFTVTAFCSGVVFGKLLNKDVDMDAKYWLHIILATAIHCILFGLFINTLWVAQLYGNKTYWGWFIYRLSEYVVMVPLQIIINPIVKEFCKKLPDFAHR